MNRIRGRAHTDQEKAEVCRRLLEAWRRTPELRLGQLIENRERFGVSLYYDEDETLIAGIEQFANELAIKRGR